MNNQFFGDERDFFKYALLRILAAYGVSIGVCWLLTEGCRKGGSKLAYLRNGKFRDLDAELFDFLREYICNKVTRNVSFLEESGIIPDAQYFSRIFPSDEKGRVQFFNKLFLQFSGRQLVFFDPDTGIRPDNPRNSEDEYIRWNELQLVDARMPESSIMVFQYFKMSWDNEQTQKRHKKMCATLRCIGGKSAAIVALWQKPIVYYFVVRPKHKRKLLNAIDSASRTLGFEKHDIVGEY